MKLLGKKILIGVTGSIAAYKTAELVRLLVKEGADIQVIMTRSAHDFVTPLTLATLSKNPVLTDFSDPLSGSWNNHVALGLWADAYIIAPLSANSLGKLASGYCENLLSAVYLSARCPVFLAPAMDLDMFAHPLVQENLSRLAKSGNTILGPESGELASGLKGEGRMSEPDAICASIIKVLQSAPELNGKKILVTAGPTREQIDPVRFISNNSSGKMGTAIAVEMAARGALVTLITGPGVKLPLNPAIICVPVISAEDMYLACKQYFSDSDVTIMCAAVADYRPAEISTSKIKKTGAVTELPLTPTRDILSELGTLKSPDQLLVGFALETDNELENAKEKLQRKNLDLIILNSMKDIGAGFEKDTNKITIIEKNNVVTNFELKSKKEVASDIADKIISCIRTR